MWPYCIRYLNKMEIGSFINKDESSSSNEMHVTDYCLEVGIYINTYIFLFINTIFASNSKCFENKRVMHGNNNYK